MITITRFTDQCTQVSFPSARCSRCGEEPEDTVSEFSDDNDAVAFAYAFSLSENCIDKKILVEDRQNEKK